MMSDYSDKELLDLFHNGDNPNYAFSLLVKKYQQKIYYCIRRIIIDHDDTHDVMQNTFVKAWKGLANFREESQLYTWLYRIASNESLNFLKKNKRNLHQSLDEAFNHPSADQHSTVGQDGEAIQKTLQRAILSLPEKQRVVFTMKYYDELKYEEISQILDTSVGALKASYFHAAKKIEEYIKNELNQIKV